MREQKSTMKYDEALRGAVGGSQVAARLSFTLCGVTLAVASQLELGWTSIP